MAPISAIFGRFRPHRSQLNFHKFSRRRKNFGEGENIEKLREQIFEKVSLRACGFGHLIVNFLKPNLLNEKSIENRNKVATKAETLQKRAEASESQHSWLLRAAMLESAKD